MHAERKIVIAVNGPFTIIFVKKNLLINKKL